MARKRERREVNHLLLSRAVPTVSQPYSKGVIPIMSITINDVVSEATADWSWYGPDVQARYADVASGACRYLAKRGHTGVSADDIAQAMAMETATATDPGALAADGKALGTLAARLAQREVRDQSAALGAVHATPRRSDQSATVSSWTRLGPDARAKVARTLCNGTLTDSDTVVRADGSTYVVTAEAKCDAVLAAHSLLNKWGTDGIGITAEGRQVGAGLITGRVGPNVNLGASWAALTGPRIRHRNSDAGTSEHTLTLVDSAESQLVRGHLDAARRGTFVSLRAAVETFVSDRTYTRTGKVTARGGMAWTDLAASLMGRGTPATRMRAMRDTRSMGRTAEDRAQVAVGLALHPSHHAGLLDTDTRSKLATYVGNYRPAAERASGTPFLASAEATGTWEGWSEPRDTAAENAYVAAYAEMLTAEGDAVADTLERVKRYR